VLTRRRGLLLIALSPILFIFSGLFLMNTVMNPSDSFPYLVGEVLCFGVAPLLLILGILVFVATSREKKSAAVRQSDAASSVKEAPLAVNPTLLLVRKVIGLILGFAFLVPPLIEGPLLKGDWSFFLAMFVLLPFLTFPYLAAILYLLFNKRPRKIDVLIILMCVLMLLCWYVAPPLTMIAALLLFFILIIIFITRAH